MSEPTIVEGSMYASIEYEDADRIVMVHRVERKIAYCFYLSGGDIREMGITVKSLRDSSKYKLLGVSKAINLLKYDLYHSLEKHQKKQGFRDYVQFVCFSCNHIFKVDTDEMEEEHECPRCGSEETEMV